MIRFFAGRRAFVFTSIYFRTRDCPPVFLCAQDRVIGFFIRFHVQPRLSAFKGFCVVHVAATISVRISIVAHIDCSEKANKESGLDLVPFSICSTVAARS